MKLTNKEVKQIKKEFQKKFVFCEPYSEWTNACGISSVGIMDPLAPDAMKGEACISVGLRQPFPEYVDFPKEYKGVKIFTRVIGELKAG